MIITQELTNYAVKVLKEAFSTSISNIISPIVWNLLNSFTSTEQVFSMIKLNDCLKEVAIKALEIAIPKIDEWFKNSQHRKTYFYMGTKGQKNRIFLFGELSYERYYYTDKNKENGFYLIDELFNFEKYTVYSPEVRALLIDHSVTTNSNLTSNNTSLVLGHYADYLNQDKFKNISRQTIISWRKKWNIPKVEYKLIEGVKELYVMVDEKWIHEQIRLELLDEEERKKHHYIMAKCFVTFTGAETKNKRTTLLNRHVFMTASDKPW